MLLFLFIDCLFSWTICAWLFFLACFSLVCFGCAVCCGFGGLIRVVDTMDYLFYNAFFDIWLLSSVFSYEYFGFLFFSVIGLVFIGCILECNFNLYYTYFLLCSFTFLFCCAFCLLFTTDFILFFLCFELCGWSLCVLIASVSFYVRRGFAFSYMLFFMMVGTVLFLFGLSILIDKFGVFIFIGLGVFVCDSYLLTIVCSVFFLFALIKLPSFPFYSWLPEAHVESSSFGSMILAGVLLKFSSIFIIRFGCVLDVNFLFLFVLDFLLLFIIGLCISSCIIVIQIDCKKIIAYLSVIHVNFSILALLNMNSFSLWIFVLLSLSHGFISSLLFFMIGIIYSVLASRVFKFINFLFFITPLFSLLFICTMLASVGFPVFFSFLGECGVIFFVFSISEILCYVIVLSVFYCFITSIMFFVRLLMFGSYTIKLFISDVTVLVAICIEVLLVLFVFLTIIF